MLRKRFFPVFILISIFVLTTAVVEAQRVTGSIRGTVTDEEGVPLPGVNVTLVSEALIGGTHSDVTAGSGSYRFPALPPGEYKLTFAIEGFQTVVVEKVRVTVGGTVDQDVIMKLATVQEQLVITGETPLVDATNPGTSTNYTQEYIENTPIARFTFFDFVQMAPASSPMRFDNTAFSHSIMGSNTNENMYQMDGTDLTSALTGAAWPWPSTDIVEEIEILDIGAPAEYGNYQGAVINVVTKSGGNDFHGDANFFFQTQGLTASNVTIDGEGPDGEPVPYSFHRDRYTDFTAQVGGPIVKDKLWFFGGVQTRREHFSEPGTPPEFPKKEDDDRFFVKATYDINHKNQIQASLHNDYYAIPGEISRTKPFDTALTETGNNPTPNALWTSIINEKTILEVRYAGFYGHDVGEPQNGQYNSGRYDFYTGYYSGGIISWYDGDIWKSQVNGKLSYYADNFLGGTHDFRFGVQYSNAGNDYIYAITNGVLYYDYAGYPYTAYFQLPYHIGANVNSIGFFADDTFTPTENLTLSLGVRVDHSTGSIPDFPQLDAAGNSTGTIIKGLGKVADWNVVSPRIGFTYRFPWKKATQIRGHYGRYYQALLTPYLQRAGPARSRIEGRAFNEDTGEYDDLFFAFDPSSQIQIDPDLKDPYTDQFAVGFDHEIAPNLAIGASYVHKRSRDFVGTLNIGAQYDPVEFIDPVTGQPITVLNQVNDPTEDNLYFITNPDFFYSDYNGFIVTVTKRMTNWQVIGSLTISKTMGFHAGSGLPPGDDQDSSFFPSANAAFGQDANDYINADGLLNGDRTYIFKLQGSYALPWDMLLSGNFTAMTGTPYARQIEVLDFLNQGSRTIFAEERDGSRRTPTVTLLDLRLEKVFVLDQRWSLSVTADLFNVFNNDAFYAVESTVSGPGREDVFGAGSVFVPPRRLMLGGRIRF